MKKNLLSLFAAITIATSGFSQINISQNRIAREQFNSIGTAANAPLPASWKMSSAGTGNVSGYNTGSNVTVTTQAAGSGTPTAGGRYNWASASGSNRAIGFMSDGAYADGNAIFANYKNATGANITELTLSYNVERFRTNTGTASVALFYSTDGSTWTAVPAGDIASSVFVPGASSYDFVSPQTVNKNINLTGLAIPNAADIYFRWVFTTGGSFSQGLALDDVALFAQPAVAVVSSSLRDNLQVDNNGNTVADAGDQIRYTMVIRNNGTADANNVSLANQTPNYTTLNPGSVKTSALARDDNYTANYNTVFAGTTVLANDFGMPLPSAVISYGPSSNAALATPGTAITTDAGGSVTVNANGTFSYTPPVNFTGTDRFKYITGNGNLPNNDATVTLNIGAKITADAYHVVGNTQLVSDGYSSPSTPFTTDATNILTNDQSNQPIAAVPVTNAATANGGLISIDAAGKFIYTPPRGYTGADSYVYSAISNGVTTTGTINFTIEGMVWYVNNTYAGANGTANGTSTRPYTDVASAAAPSLINEAIYVHTGSGNTTGNIVLKNGQRLVGQGALFLMYELTIPAGTKPTLTGSITLASNIMVHGFHLNTGSNTAITGTGVSTVYVDLGDLTVNGAVNAVSLTNVSGNLTFAGGTVSNTTGTSFVVSGGDAALAYAGDVTQTLNVPMLSVSGGHSGSVVFSTGLINITNGTGLQFDNADGIYNFFGTTVLGGGDAGIDILNGSSGSFLFDVGTTISNPTNEGLNMANSTAMITYRGNIFYSGTGAAIRILNHSVGTVTFETGNVNVFGGTGFSFTNCSSTYSFNGFVSMMSNTTSGIAITSSAGTFNFNSNTALSGGATIPRLSISGTANVSFAGSIAQSSGAPAIFVSGHSGGTITISGSVGGTGSAGLQFDNADGIYNFTGSINLNGGFAGVNIYNGSAGNFSFGSNSNLTSPSGTAFNLTGGTATVTYSGNITQANAFPAVAVSGGHALGTVTFQTNTINATLGTGLQFDNADGTYNFNGTTTLNGGDAGIDILNGSGGTFSFGTGTAITNPSGNAFTIGGTANTAGVTYSGSMAKNSAGAIISITNHLTGTVLFQTGTINATPTVAGGTGIQFDNADGIYNFTAAVTLSGASNGDAGIDVLNGSGGTISFSNAGSNISNPANELIKVNASAATFTYSGTFTKNNNSVSGITVSSNTGGTVTINGTSTKVISCATANAINLTSNTGATINFSGNNLSLTTSSGTGFNATGGGTISVAGTGNIISSSGGTALNVNATTISATGLNFQSISAASSASTVGIILNTTGTLGGLTVTGTGTAGSGGTIANKTGTDGQITNGIGIYLNSTKNVSLSRMQINDCQNYGVLGSTVDGFSFLNCVLNGTNGTNETLDEAAMAFTNLTGSATITGSTISGGIEDNLRVINGAGTTLNRLTINGSSTIGLNSTSVGDNGILLQANSNAVFKATIQNTTFTGARGDVFQFDLTGTANGDLVFSNNTSVNAHPAIASGGGGINISGGGSTASNVTLTYDIFTNTLQKAKGDAILVNLQTGGGNFTGKVRSNIIGTAGTDLSGSAEASGIAIKTTGSGNQSVLVDNNQVRQYNANGILLQVGGQMASGNGSTGTMNATVTNNIVNTPGSLAFPGYGFQLNSGFAAGDAFQVCLNLLNNTLAGSGSVSAGSTDFIVRNRFSTTDRLPGYAGANNDNAAVVAFLQAQNTGIETGTSSNNVAGGGGGFTGGAACVAVP